MAAEVERTDQTSERDLCDGDAKTHSPAPDVARIKLRQGQTNTRKGNKPSMPRMPWDDQ